MLISFSFLVCEVASGLGQAILKVKFERDIFGKILLLSFG